MAFEMKVTLYAAFGIVVFLVVLKLAVNLLEPRLTFFPNPRLHESPLSYGIQYQEYSLDVQDGVKLNSWYLPQEGSIAEVIFFHGNAGNISAGRLELLAELHRNGFAVFVFDYRGYGKSSGSPTESGICLDSVAAAEFFWRELHRKNQKVVYFGRSLGGVTASAATRSRQPDGLILEATFADKRTLLSHFPLPLRILALFSRYELSTIGFLEKLSCPVLVIHGDQDDVIPFDCGKDLFSRVKTEEKDFLRIRGASHMDQYVIGGERYWSAIREFVNRLEGPR